MGKLTLIISYDHRGRQTAKAVHMIPHKHYELLVVPIVEENYAQTAIHVAQAVVLEHESFNYNTFGVLICGSGVGMCLAANKVKGARAAVIQNIGELSHAIRHNDVNVFCFSTAKNIPTHIAAIIAQIGDFQYLAGKYAIRARAIKDL